MRSIRKVSARCANGSISSGTPRCKGSPKKSNDRRSRGMNKINKTTVRARVRKSVRVGAPPDGAFKVFTDGIGRGWPKPHHIGAADLDALVIEPKAGGRWYERGVDGSECEVGKVLVWDPP